MEEQKKIGLNVDELDSDDDDDDYMPSAEESEEEINSAVEDDVEDSSPNKNNKRKGKVEQLSSRKRRGGIRLENEGEKEVEENDATDNSQEKEESRVLSEESQKKRSDSLWADFLSDVSPPTKKGTIPKLVKPVNPIKKVTVTKIYQFAGEEVKVMKAVDVNSKDIFQEASKDKETRLPEPEDKTAETETPAQTSGPHRSGLSSVLGKISGPKNKLSTLEKSKLDWDQFKQENNLSEDLQHHNKGKDGYLGRQSFLERTDLRQFELEKNLRIKSRNKSGF